MDWPPLLESEETLLWESKPAPRCYTFRNWRRTILGLLLLTLAIYWEITGLGLPTGFGPALLGWFLLPLFAAGLWFSVGHYILARREWENVFYGASNRRLLVQRGLIQSRRRSLDLDKVSGYRLHPHGQHLADVQVFVAHEKKSLTFHCIEHPEQLTAILEKAMAEHEPPTFATSSEKPE
ncbi:PH domain-containing protein [Geoalkalibacter ferrihydriticus]|uniref:YdbS-like PH domain-containing protein n=2 Tax=Geoalkalibacter ferrihydriticus TaxID=392333 RepID=A0A0C2DQT7_9BACT|nr:PH domain-containing protein [Geoalkalibacter ferrihydriticus]KIH75794.1 hypothetical protein GFER_14460 [Geoalkalibacter ferrihydriticus DSM 17813]SDM65429.1 PH domain-containing protein [Geoalkalibacter ferrihydriticus]